MSKRRPEHYIGAKETHYLICDEDAHLALVLAKMEAWQRWTDRQPNRDKWFWMSARQMSEQMMGILGKSKINTYMNRLVDMGLAEKRETDDPQEPTKWSVDMERLAELRGQYADENGYINADKREAVRSTDTPRPQHGHPVRSMDTTKSTNNDCLSTKHAREDEPTDFSKWIEWKFAQYDIEISPAKAGALASSIVAHNMSSEDDKRYVIDKLKQAVVTDKPTRQALYYMGNKSDLEQWQGDTTDDDESETVYTDYSW